MVQGAPRIGLRIMPMVLGLALLGCNEKSAPPALPPAEVRVAPPLARPVTRYLELTGQTAAAKRVDLVARVQGTLTDIRYRDGASVKQGDVLFVIEPDNYRLSLELAEAAEAQQKALLVQAEADLVRQKQLASRQAASEAALDSALGKRDSTAAAREQAAAQAAQARLNLAYTEVKAPFDGVVSAHLIDQGALVGVGGPTLLASIVQSDPIKVRFSLDEQTVLRIREAMRQRGLTLAGLGSIPVEIGLETDSGYPHAGQLDYVAPELDMASGTLSVRAAVPNPQGVLLPGLFVRVRLPLQKDVPSLLVPEAALGASQTGRYLLVVGADDIVEQRAVETGETSEGGLRVIRSGLSASDRVVVGLMQNAIPGSRVRPVAAVAKAAR
ncbi:efflux RND transporter periplasmic adaptor subunit [Bosea sp. (in: a-proteobacteria)]|uniref:efflux RND transporter periplasmic adaptor subunit n=1 Tax=Bosea sp. (in: a-proteobacteria) TaxID=1871050 RepID=UPI002734A322|nr:efflux RND transporter periplasmic adaptor subunit [Bosea sp. (in: a-proteobacteria)]MDP3408797.1 efflux RND transporter periplasmic adaptor subunit [Bosea sp. (in: a-proteobacteria)]